MDVTVAKLEASVKSAHRRLDEVSVKVQQFQELCGTVERMDEKVDTLKRAVEEIKADVKALSAVPSHHWDRLISAVIGAAVSAAVAALTAMMR